MEKSYENLRFFFDEIKKIGFWQRLFAWKRVRTLSYEAFVEFELLLEDSRNLKILENSTELVKKDNENLKGSNYKLEGEVQSYKKENEALRKENTVLEQTVEGKMKEYDKNITNVNVLTANMETDRQKMNKEREEDISKRFALQKLTWLKHEEDTKTTIREICRKHIIEYIDREQVPFKGKPDNTIKICDEYIIFDAKSPANDNLENFPVYLKQQTESVKKYIKEENVKKDVFLVVPSNTTDVVEQFAYNMADYNVYIITLDALEPVILSLRKIEDYEFAEQLSPEDRDSISRIIGKFVHTTKRKIEIDNFFSDAFLSIVRKSEQDLPQEMIKRVVEFELAEKLNPPTDKRAKQISTSDLEKNTASIRRELQGKTENLLEENKAEE